MPEDLKLDQALIQRQVISPKPNSHDRIDCLTCHQTRPPRAPEADLNPERFTPDGYEDELCQSCHQERCNFHPIIIEPDNDIERSMPDVFPLQYIYEGRYKIVCISCHDIHFPHNGFKLLRGFSINPRKQPSSFNTRLDFCRSCHNDEINSFSPHKDGAEQKGCLLCHSKKPQPGHFEPLKENVNTLCCYCHPLVQEAHYLHFNPFPDIDPEQLASSGTRLIDGAYTCITCHMSHGSSPYSPYLNTEYVKLARASTRINPHDQTVFCLSCHPYTPLPVKGSAENVPVVEDSVTKLCNKCHQSGKITGMHHPLKVLPEDFITPEDLKLDSENSVTCITCHQVSCDKFIAEYKLLRGGPYQSIIQLCNKCHLQRSSTLVNPHEGFQNKQSCPLCHEDGATYRVGAETAGPLKADTNFLCLRCHDYFPHPAGFKHNVRPGQYDYVTMNGKNIILDSFGRMTCCSCHEIHQVTEMPFLLRQSLGKTKNMICGSCHPY